VVRVGGFRWEILRAVGRVALPASWNGSFVFFAGFVVKWFQNPWSPRAVFTTKPAKNTKEVA